MPEVVVKNKAALRYQSVKYIDVVLDELMLKY